MQKHNTLITALLVLCFIAANGQNMLITIKGDTISGKIRPISTAIDKKVSVTTADDKKQSFSMFQIRAYFIDGEKFIPVKMTEGYTYMKVVKEGYLSLLASKGPNQGGYNDSYLLKKDGAGMTVPNLGFKKHVSRFLSDVQEVSQRVEGGEFGRFDLEKLVDAYNKEIEQRSTNLSAKSINDSRTTQKISAWEKLENKISSSTIDGKQDALDMIADIKGKISRKEKVPNFLIESLKNAVKEANADEEVAAALKEIQVP